jgi:cytochrome c peroxidase
MGPQTRWRIRWTLLLGTWLLVFIPTVRSQQQQPVPNQQVVTFGPDFRIITRGGPVNRRLSEMKMLVPPDNPMTDDKIALGRRLFFDARLSADRSVSCATCHDPERAFADDRSLAVGVFERVGRRHSPALINRGFGTSHFWDGRARTLEQQVLQPIADPNEMDLSVAEAIMRLDADADYRAAFQTVFARPVSSEDLARALATYVRSIQSADAPYDRFVAGETNALSEEQQRGLALFRGRARCVFCHREPLFTDEVFWNTGVAVSPGPLETAVFRDDGRFGVNSVERERGKFKTPTLREVARTAPYMHDGSLATLSDVVDFYDKGGRPNRNLFPLIRPLNLSADEKQALIKFLESLNGVVSGK